VVTLPPILISEAKAIAELSGYSVSLMVEESLGQMLKEINKRMTRK
jgi:hypothetical protein